MAEADLNGAGVMLTRPRHQTAELAAEIERRGGRVFVFPALEIVGRAPAHVAADAAALLPPDISVFISRNAVDHGLAWGAGKIAAIGPATASAIEASGKTADILPGGGFDSEALLAEPALHDVAGKVIRIIRGDAGRELLARTLTERGATVDYLATYERRMPEHPPTLLAEIENRWRDGGIAAVVSMSVFSLRNLAAILPGWCHEQLAQTPLVTPSTRVLKEAQNRYPGCPVLLAVGPRSSDIADAVAAAVGGHDAPGTH
ncbi:MAG: uroporphyrinogen-III synthase [Woeseiaceae bacterium]